MMTYCKRINRSVSQPRVQKFTPLVIGLLLSQRRQRPRSGIGIAQHLFTDRNGILLLGRHLESV